MAKFNFLATANGDYIPAGEPRPPELLSLLRNYTVEYSNILSLDRADAKKVHGASIALELFLGNPILPYSHHNLFLPGPGGFNKQAEIINKIGPSIHWANLATIARHLYLTRRLPDGAIYVLAYCREMEVANPLDNPEKFWIRKDDAVEASLRTLCVNGSPSIFKQEEGSVLFTVDVAPRLTARIEFVYDDDLDLGSIDIANKSRRVAMLRRISDFRDITLSSSFLVGSSRGSIMVRVFTVGEGPVWRPYLGA